MSPFDLVPGRTPPPNASELMAAFAAARAIRGGAAGGREVLVGVCNVAGELAAVATLEGDTQLKFVELLLARLGFRPSANPTHPETRLCDRIYEPVPGPAEG